MRNLHRGAVDKLADDRVAWLALNRDFWHDGRVERVVHKAKSFREAERLDIEQQVAMTPNERIRAAKVLRDRGYPANPKDVRECHRSR